MAGPNDINLGIRIKADAAGASAQFQQAADGVGRIKEQLNGAKMGAAAYFEAMQRGQSVQQGSTNEAQKFVEAMKREAETLGFTALQLKAYKASKMELTDAQALSLAQSFKTIQAYEQQQTAMKGAETQSRLTASAVGLMTAAWSLAADAAVKAVAAAKDYIKESALLNARHETLGIVMSVVGRNAGYMSTEMETAARTVERYGVSMNTSREVVIRMAQANIDLAQASKIAALAQDAQHVAGISASQAIERLTHGIVTGQPEVLRMMGITVNFEQAYKEMARTVGVSTDQLTEHEKMQARTTVTLAQHTRVMGVHADVSKTATGQLAALEAQTENLKTIRGEVFNDALILAVEAYTQSTKQATEQSQRLHSEGKLKEWGQDALELFAMVADGVRNVAKIVQDLIEAIAQAAVGGASFAAKAIQYLSPATYLANRAMGDPLGRFTRGADNYTSYVEDRITDRNKNFNSSLFADTLADQVARKRKAEEEKYLADLEKDLKAIWAPMETEKRPAGAKHGGSGKNEFEEAERWVESLAKKLHGLEGEGSLYAEVVEKIVWGTVKLTKAHELQAEKMALEYDAKKAAIAATKELQEALARETRELEESNRLRDAHNSKVLAAGDAIDKNIKNIEFETTLIGKNNAEREKAIQLRNLEAQSGLLSDSAQQQNRERLTAALDARAAAQQIEDTRKKQLDENARMVDDISRSVGEALQRGSKSGIKGMMDDLKEAFRKAVFRVAVQPYINAAVSGVAGLLGMALPSTAGASGGGGTGSLGLLGSVFNLARGLFSGSSGSAAGAAAGGGGWVSGYDLLDAGTSAAAGGGGLLSGFSGLSTLGGIGSALFGNSGGGAGGLIGGLSGLVNGGFQSLGVSTGSQFLADIGNFGYGMPVVGAALQLATGNYAGAAGTAIGAAIGSVVPVIGTAVGAMVGSLIGSLVGGGGRGGGPAQNGGYDFTGMASRAGLSGTFAAHAYNSKQQFTVQTNDWMGGRADALINDLFDKFERAATVLGADPAVIRNKSYSAYFKTMDTSDNAQVMAAVQAGLGGIAEQMAKDLIPNIEKLKNANESLIDTFARLANEAESKKLTDIFNNMGAAISLQDATRDLFLTELSPLTNAQRLAEAGTRYGEVLTKAQGGDTAAFGSLAQFSRTYLGEARNFYASSQSYTDIFNRVQSEVNSVVNDTLTEQSMQFAQMGLTLKDIEANTKNLDQRIADAITRALEAQATTSAALAKANTDTLVASQQASTAALQAAITALSTAQVTAANSGTAQMVYATVATTAALNEALSALRAEQAAAATGNATTIAAATAASSRELQEAIDAMRQDLAAAQTSGAGQVSATTQAAMDALRAAVESLQAQHTAAVNASAGTITEATKASTTALVEALTAVVNVTSGGTGQVTSAITDLRDAQVAATQSTATSLKAAIEALPTATAVATSAAVESAVQANFFDAEGNRLFYPVTSD